MFKNTYSDTRPIYLGADYYNKFKIFIAIPLDL